MKTKCDHALNYCLCSVEDIFSRRLSQAQAERDAAGRGQMIFATVFKYGSCDTICSTHRTFHGAEKEAVRCEKRGCYENARGNDHSCYSCTDEIRKLLDEK